MPDLFDPDSSPLFNTKKFDEPSVFTPDALLENARRQKDLAERPVPDLCILDPDGDIVRQLVATDEARCLHPDQGYRDPDGDIVLHQ